MEPAEEPVWPHGALMEVPPTEADDMTRGESDDEFGDPGAYFKAMSEFLMKSYYDAASSGEPSPEPCHAEFVKLLQ